MARPIETGGKGPPPLRAGRIVIEWEQHKPSAVPHPLTGKPIEFTCHTCSEPLEPYEPPAADVLARLFQYLADLEAGEARRRP